ncbi:putative 1,4-dihydroxy-2-naphthoate octaprenyltransferase [Mycobacterium xenopi 3993]|nr:putative 1,4-dihydroxy-2-naphthoate octaprenyltransferase [Mycobacterium xenopi 3993]
MASLSIGAAAGLVLALASAPWLIVVGVLCVTGAWLYTGGAKPYGYAGLARPLCSCSSVWSPCWAPSTPRRCESTG